MMRRMHQDADDAASEACREVDQEIADASEGEFDERPDLIEDVHVEGDVDDAEVNEAGGEETPVLVGAEGEGAVVSTPVLHGLECWLGG